MKKITVLIVFLITSMCFMVTSNAEPSVAENDEVRLYVDGKQCEYNDSLIVSNGSFLSPMESFLADLGVPNDNEHVIWSSDKKSVSIIKEKININLVIGSHKAKVNSKEIVLNAPPAFLKNKVYVPVRFIAESLGRKVLWDENCIFIYDYSTANKVKDYITKAFSILSSSDKYKLTINAKEDYHDSSKKDNITCEISRSKNLAHFLMYETRNNSVTSNETYLYNNLLFNRFNDGKWTWIESNKNEIDRVISEYSKFKLVEKDCIGFSLNDFQNTDQVILKTNSYSNGVLFGVDNPSEAEVVINKKTGCFEKISFKTGSTDENASVEITFSGFNSDFEITVPDEITGAILVEEEKYDEALLYYDKLIQNHPDNVQLYVEKVGVLKELNRLDEALTTCDRFINLNAENSAILMAKAEILVDLERLEEALQCYNKVIKLDSSNYEVYSEKADVLIKLDRLDEALECLNTASDMLEQSLHIDEK